MNRKSLAIFRIFILSIFLVCAVTITTFAFAHSSDALEQRARTVQYSNQTFFDDDYIAQFDDFQYNENNNDLSIVATKTFSASLLEEIDLVCDENEEFTVRYEIEYLNDDSTILLKAFLVGEEVEELTDTIPGLVSYNEDGKTDVLFNVDEEYVWLSELTDGLKLEEAGWLKNAFKKVAATVTQVAQKVKTAVKSAVDTAIDATQQAINKLIAVVKPIVKPIVDASLKVAYKILGEDRAAKWGAAVLMMYEDPGVNGVFHAAFNCWQKYFGYIDVYDNVFDAATRMDKREYEFTYNGKDYKFWGWKGDYLNLGTGCELGIYTRWEYGSNIWVVDENYAVPMTAKLTHGNNTVIDWNPAKYNGQTVGVIGNLITTKIKTEQWWITGFNSKYKCDTYANDRSQFAYELKATFNVDLAGSPLKDAFFNYIKGASNAATLKKEITINGNSCTISF